MIKPIWLRKPLRPSGEGMGVRKLMADEGLHTVCREARCPNMGECYGKGVATFLILGDRCTRNCGFCAVTHTGEKPAMPDAGEPARVATAAAKLGLRHVVVTSVTRDDLPDGGASHFASVISALREDIPSATVEVLTPDFGGARSAIDTVIFAKPDIYNHNVETVPSLYRQVRPAADYRQSLDLLARVKHIDPTIVTKSGIMLGLGETEEEVCRVMRDLRDAGCEMLTIGQYLRPSLANLPVREYALPEVFNRLREIGENLGFARVFSGPFVRSSYQAEELCRPKSLY